MWIAPIAHVSHMPGFPNYGHILSFFSLFHKDNRILCRKKILLIAYNYTLLESQTGIILRSCSASIVGCSTYQCSLHCGGECKQNADFVYSLFFISRLTASKKKKIAHFVVVCLHLYCSSLFVTDWSKFISMYHLEHFKYDWLFK